MTRLRRLLPKACLAVAVPALVLLAAEGALRAFAFEAPLPPVVVRGRELTPLDTADSMIGDPDLIWRFNPGREFRGRRVNRLGFLDREVAADKTRGTVRVICLGDSCAGQGFPPYSGLLHRQLTNAPPTAQPWEAFNMAVHGYSVAQGHRLFQMTGRRLAPDLVAVCYGWNDHLLARQPDRLAMAVGMPRMLTRVSNVLRRTRSFQFVVYVANPRRATVWAGEGGALRVPPDRYRAALGRLIADIRNAGAVPLVITAPRAERVTSLLVRNGQATSVEEAIRLHDEYAEITREVAREAGAPLLDLAERFRAPAAAPLFADDGIHFKDAGRVRIAEAIYAAVQEIVRSPAWQARH